MIIKNHYPQLGFKGAAAELPVQHEKTENTW